MMAHAKVVDRWEEGNPTTVPADAKFERIVGGGQSDPFLFTVYVDDYLLSKVQHSDVDSSALNRLCFTSLRPSTFVRTE